jgi:diguanylate cyclase (GGDEF)-like protein
MIREVGRKIGLSIRGTDSAGRFSSDEFGLILTKTDPSLLDKTVDHVRKRIMEITVRTPDGENIHPVLSVGVALCGETTASTEVLTRAAGQALGRARQRGDCVEVSALPKLHE